MSDILFPANAPSMLVSASTTASTSVPLPSQGNSLRIVNEGPNNAYISVGSGIQTAAVPSVTANASSVPILAGTDIVLSIAPLFQINQISAITLVGTASLQVSIAPGGM
jgi:hypothetical protein